MFLDLACTTTVNHYILLSTLHLPCGDSQQSQHMDFWQSAILHGPAVKLTTYFLDHAITILQQNCVWTWYWLITPMKAGLRVKTNAQQTSTVFLKQQQTVSDSKPCKCTMELENIFGEHRERHIKYCTTWTFITGLNPWRKEIFTVPGNKVYGWDRSKGEGSGALICVKESIQNKQTDIRENTLECVGFHITLSPQMSFVIFTVLLASYCYKFFFFGLFMGMKEKKLFLRETSTKHVEKISTILPKCNYQK